MRHPLQIIVTVAPAEKNQIAINVLPQWILGPEMTAPCEDAGQVLKALDYAQRMITEKIVFADPAILPAQPRILSVGRRN